MADDEKKPAGEVIELSGDLPIDQNVHGAPVILVDGASSFGMTQDGLVKFNFYQDRMTVATGQTKIEDMVTRVVCARLAMGITPLRAILQWLQNHLAEAEKAHHGKSDK